MTKSLQSMLIAVSLSALGLGGCTQYDAARTGPVLTYSSVPESYQEPVMQPAPRKKKICAGGMMRDGRMVCPRVSRAQPTTAPMLAGERAIAYQDPARGGSGSRARR